MAIRAPAAPILTNLINKIILGRSLSASAAAAAVAAVFDAPPAPVLLSMFKEPIAGAASAAAGVGAAGAALSSQDGPSAMFLLLSFRCSVFSMLYSRMCFIRLVVQQINAL